MKQLAQAKFESGDHKIQLLCDADTSLGNIHDFLMALKGEIVDRMVKAQKEEEEITKKQSEVSEEKSDKIEKLEK